MKKILFLIALLGSAMTLWAQSPTENPKQRISEVKQAEGQYFYADQTSETVEKALEKAQEILLREVMDYLQQSGEDIGVAPELLKDQMVTITIQRGDKFRAFVYIDKQLDRDAALQKPTAEMVTVETGEAIPEAETTQEVQQAAPMADPAITDEPASMPTATASSTILQQIGAMTTRLQVYDYITQLQNDGEKVLFATHPEADELESMYVVLYKRGGAIEAILTPPDAQGQRYNIATGLPDAQANHPATSVNGFKLNE